MIDCHVHLRDWNWSYKETILHGLNVAEAIGLDGIFDMPNTDPAIISRELVKKRLEDAKKANSPVFYGLYVGLTSNPFQIKEAIECYKEFFPKEGENAGVIGLKMFAGKSVGDLSVVSFEDQLKVYETLAKLDYLGVLAVHCEKESEMHPELWNPRDPISHCDARPKIAEIRSIEDQIKLAETAQYKGHLHILHVTTPESVDIINKNKKYLRISSGVTPNHLLLSNRVMRDRVFGIQEGIGYKVNPPLRDPLTKEELFQYFKDGAIDILESDHAPHSFEEKYERGYLSGIPGLTSWPRYLELLVKEGASSDLIDNMTHPTVNRIFGTNIKKRGSKVDYQKLAVYAKDYALDPCEHLPAKV
ncbi:MAG: dihydroorotase [Candidatus Pacearchaeota archaeon]|jgi:dihydroorotase